MFKHGKKKQKKAALQAAAVSAAAVGTSATSEVTTQELERLRSSSSLSVPVAGMYVKDTSDDNSAGSEDSHDTIGESISCISLNGDPKQQYIHQTSVPPRFLSTSSLSPGLQPPTGSQYVTVASLLKKNNSQPSIPPNASTAGNDYKPVGQILKYTAPTTADKKQQTTMTALAPPVDAQTAELISSAVAFGLGRGIDATNQTPWANKSSFQIRRVQRTVVETKESGALESYEHEIFSAVDTEEKLRSSLEPPEIPLSINVESEPARNSHQCLRRAVGRRVISRTIAFQTDYEERAIASMDNFRSDDSLLLPKDPTEVVFNAQSSHLAFEERLSEWICQRIARKQYLLDGQRMELCDSESPTDRLAKMLHVKSVQGVEKEVMDGCKELVEGLRVTHYVSSIKLGAAQYCVMSDGEYRKKLANAGAFGLDAIAEAITPSQSSSNGSRKASNMRRLGFISGNGRVERGSQNEAVLEFTAVPITRLIRLPALKAALKDAVKKYMKTTVDPQAGPFVLKCAGKDVYLTVNRFNSYEVEGTEVTAEASLFHFIPADSGNSFNYHIAYYSEDIGSEEESPNSVCCYLEAPIDTMGKLNSTLYMKHSVKTRLCRFTLRSRLAKKHTSCTPSSLLTGDNAFYIACATKKLQHGSYVGLRSSKKSNTILGAHFYTTACYPSIHLHDGDTTNLLFQLIPKAQLTSDSREDLNGAETPKIVAPLDHSPLHSQSISSKHSRTPSTATAQDITVGKQ